MKTITDIENEVRGWDADDFMDFLNSLDAATLHNFRREAKDRGLTTREYLRRELPGIIYAEMKAA